MKSGLLFSLFVTGIILPAVSQGNVMYYLPDSSLYTFGNHVNVRAEAHAKARSIAKLHAGTRVRFLETTADSHTVSHMTYPWIKVEFQENNREQQGYIWGGMFSFLHRQFRDKNGQVLTLMAAPKEILITGNGKEMAGEVRLYRDTTLLSTYRIELRPGYRESYFDFGVFDYDDTLNPQPYGDHIFRCSFSYESCGPNGELNILVKNDRIIFAGTDDGAVDGGVFWADNAYFFPWEPEGEKDKIIRKYELEENEEDDNGEIIHSRKEEKVLETWLWDGNRFVLRKP